MSEPRTISPSEVQRGDRLRWKRNGVKVEGRVANIRDLNGVKLGEDNGPMVYLGLGQDVTLTLLERPRQVVRPGDPDFPVVGVPITKAMLVELNGVTVDLMAGSVLHFTQERTWTA